MLAVSRIVADTEMYWAAISAAFSQLFLVWCKVFSGGVWVVCLFLVTARRKLLHNFPRAWETCCETVLALLQWHVRWRARSVIWIRTASHCFIWINTDTGPSCRSPISSGPLHCQSPSIVHIAGCRYASLCVTVRPTAPPVFAVHPHSILKLHVPPCFRIFS